MKRKTYMEPTTKVVKLQHRTHLLTGSGEGLDASRNGYGKANDGVGGTDSNGGIWIWQ